jgi:hypothetical protein
VRRQRWKAVVTVRVPLSQSPFFFLPGELGGWFVSLLYGHGQDVLVDLAKLGELLDGSRGSVVIGRRLAGAELRFLESYLGDIGAEVHARIVARDELRWRSPRNR